jgi:NAD(P)-dependent dehydrogenase (short-subunit alcohol dehydrogenase family)
MSSTTGVKVAVITGGSTGIGKAVAFKLAGRGIAVVIAGRDKERGDTVATELAATGAKALFVQTNVSSEQEVQNLVEQAITTYGRIDYLFNNAGTEGAMGPLDMNTEEIIDEVLASNIKGVLLSIKHVMPVMVKQGSGVIINTASFVGTIIPFPVAVVYGASKAAVLSITRSVAASCAGQDIQVFAICPWVTDTPMIDRLTGFQPGAKDGFAGNINPSGKIATTDDIATVVAALFTKEKALESGEAILIDSGGSTNKISRLTVE